MLASLALAAIAAAFVVLATASVVFLQRKENAETKREYEAYTLTASKDIAAAETRGKIAEQKAAEANERARKSELELAKLQTPRTLTPEQHEALVKLLAPMPKGPVAVSAAIIDSTDAKPFARSIEAALKGAGFDIYSPPDSIGKTLGWERPGAWIFVHNIVQSPPHAAPLQVAFAAIGIYLEGLSMPNDIPPEMVVIAVSSHPLKSEPIPEELLNRIPKTP